MLIKHLNSNICTQRWWKAIIGDFRGLCQNLPYMQCLKVRIEWGHNF